MSDDNIIEFVPRKTPPEKEVVTHAKNMAEYLKLCKRTLTEEDYVDVLCGIMDQEIYENLDQDLKNIVNKYFSHKF